MGAMGFLFGLVCLATGLYGYLAKGAPQFFAIRWNISGFYLLVPLGLGFVLFGIGDLWWGRHPLMDIFFTLGLALCALGVLLVVYHPRWIRPWWLKDGSTWL